MKILERTEFIARAKRVRNDYDYNMTHYTGMRNKILVKCKNCKKRGRIYPRQVLLNQKIDCQCVNTRRGRNSHNK